MGDGENSKEKTVPVQVFFFFFFLNGMISSVGPEAAVSARCVRIICLAL